MNAVNYQVLKQSLILPKAVEYVERQNLNLSSLGITDYVWTCVRIKLTPTQRKSIQQMIGFGWQVVGAIRSSLNEQAAVMRHPDTMELSVVYPRDSRPERHGRSLGVLRSDWQHEMKPRLQQQHMPIVPAKDQFKSSVGINSQFWE